MKSQKSIRQPADKSQKGQVILILVLITVVGLTVGLSLISRTVTDVRISSQIEQSGRAFSAAEAGIETALKTAVVDGPTGTVQLEDNTRASYSVNSLGGTTNAYTFPLTSPNSSQTLWLIPHNAQGSIDQSAEAFPTTSSFDVCFGSDASGKPALVLSLYYKDGVDYKVAKLAYDSDGTRGNNFYTVDSAGSYCGSIYKYKKTLTPSSSGADGFNVSGAGVKLLAMRINVLYDSTTIAIKPATTALPAQGKLITSIGQTETQIVRKIQVREGYQSLPNLLDFTLFREN